jgi:cell division septation protein DedD
MTKMRLIKDAILAGSVLASAVALAAPAWADVKTGVDAWSRGDYDAAVREWQVPAQRGDADAQFNLAQAYKLGRGVKVDLAKAEELFGKAASRGHLQASDNFGLLLFQRGERAQAMPYISAAASRGDPRAQYLLGLAYFNGDNVSKDWVQAYALVSLAQQAALPQATPALAQMDQYIPLEQRQSSVVLASRLATEAEANRSRQIAAADLGSTVPTTMPGRPTPAARLAEVASAENAVAAAARAAGSRGPRGADAPYSLPRGPTAAPAAALAGTPRPTPPIRQAGASPTRARIIAAPARGPAPATTAVAPATGAWRVQLGAFGVLGNAEALWNRVKGRAELSGHNRLLIPVGRVTKLQAGGFANQSEAQAACARLSAAGFACIATRN